MFPESKPDSDGIYSIINDDMRIRFADMPNQTNSLMFSLILNTTDIPQSVRYW